MIRIVSSIEEKIDRQQEYEDDDTPFMSSFPGVLVAMVAGAIFETVCLIVGDLGIGFVIAAFLTHKFWEIHDSVVYYRLHGEFMPIADDMGYCFFLMLLGSIYVIWIPAVIIAVIIKRKDESKRSKEVEN